MSGRTPPPPSFSFAYHAPMYDIGYLTLCKNIILGETIVPSMNFVMLTPQPPGSKFGWPTMCGFRPRSQKKIFFYTNPLTVAGVPGST